MVKFSKEKRKLIKSEIKQIQNEINVDKSKLKSRSERREFEQKEEFKRFQQIYLKYGKDAYLKYVPDKYRACQLNYLKINRLYLYVYEQFGEEEIKEHLEQIKENDIEYEVGKLRAVLYKIKHTILKKIIPTAAATTLGLPTGFALLADTQIRSNEEKYMHEIEEYIDDIKEYSEEIKSHNLTDLQNIMLVMDDMWNRIEGYGEPEFDLISHPGLDIGLEGGVGVCRNMADDYARRMNEINPKYNARKLIVYADPREHEPANIEVKFADNQKSEDSQDQEGGLKIDPTWITGNHAVVLMTIPDEDIELIVDPTNRILGIYQNGKITVFNASKKNPTTLDVKPAGAAIYGTNSFFRTPVNFVKSIGFKDIEKYSKMFGVEAQNKALEEVRAIREDEFENRIRYDIKTNTVTIATAELEEKQVISKDSNERG